ncbi:MAG: ATP-binding protein [Acidobacteriota bacterium]
MNLLDNARRHASEQPGAISLRLDAAGPAQVRLVVASDGEPIRPDVEPHLFEPFFSTRSRGSGLGLYICRELCERHGASVDYRPAPPGHRHPNQFVVTMRTLYELTLVREGYAVDTASTAVVPTVCSCVPSVMPSTHSCTR